MDRKRVLFLAHLLPFPLTGGGQIKSYHTLKALATCYDVTLLAFIRSDAEQEHLHALQPFCTGGIHTVLLQRRRAAALLAPLTGASFIVSRDNVPQMHRRLEELQSVAPFDAIHVDHLQMVQFIPEGFTGKTILDEHNVEYRIPQRLAQTSKNLLLRLYATGEWQRLRHFEERACRMADVVLAVSDEDRAALATHGANVATYPIGVDLDYFHPIRRNPDADMIVSIGTMYWLPNVEGIQWFVKDILPLVHEKRPQTRLRIVGAKPTPEVEALASDQIEVTGFVNDTRETVTDCGVFIVPLRSGSGMRVKILNAMAMGLPLVSTTVGAEGIAVTHGENCLLADTPADFAKAILHLLQNPAEAQRLGTNARCLMEAQYGWEAVTGRLLETYAEVLG